MTDYERKYNKYKYKIECMKAKQQVGGIGTKSDLIKFTQAYIKRIRYNGMENGKFNTGDYINTVDLDVLDQNSEFRIGSISKVFMDITILLMHENNKLNINDKLSYYINSKNPKNNFSTVTLLDVMNHRSGMKRSSDDRKHDEAKPGEPVPKYKNATEVMNLFIDEPLFEHNHGTYSYSNIGFIILGAIIEKITLAKNYSKIIKKYLIRPLKMSHTNIGETNMKLYNANGKLLSQNEFNEIYYAAGSGGFYSTIYDMITFSKNMTGLFKTPDLIKSLDICTVSDLGIMLQHHGLIAGGTSNFSVEYTPKFKFVDCRVEFETIAS